MNLEILYIVTLCVKILLKVYLKENWSRDSSVGTVTRYGLDGMGIESRWGRDFPYRCWGPHSFLYNGYRGSFSGEKRPGRGVNHPLLSR